MFLLRRQSNKNPERDVLRHDVILFRGVYKISGQRGRGKNVQRRARCSPLNIYAPKPHQRWVPCFTPSPLVPMRSCFRRINEQFDRACLNPTKTFSKTDLRAAKPNLHRGRIFAHACKSRRAPRPRKPDETLSRHGLGARRVALLAPRGVLSKYQHPLGYVGAITKIFGKAQKLVPHFGRHKLYSEWGRSPGGEEGDNNSYVSVRQQVLYSPNTTHTLSKSPRDEQPIRSVPEHDEQLDRASLRTTKPVACFERVCSVAFTHCP